MTNGAVVFAGGGVAGIAWETGVLYGIQEAEPATYDRIVDVATTFVGTSAGSAVAAQIAGGTPLSTLFDAQLSDETAELAVDLDLSEFMAVMGAALAEATSPEDVRRRIGRIAMEATTPPSSARLTAVGARLPVKEWSSRRLLITAIDTESGELRVFDRSSGVDLVLAVAASCAVPGVWPPVEIEGHRYMDGGMRTSANLDLAAGAERILILTPSLPTGPLGPVIPQADLDAVAPARIHTVYADNASIAAFGSNPLDPAVRRPAALAGRAIGRRIAAEVTTFWG